MGRRLLAIGLTLALQVAALSAPLVHAHVDDHHDDHHAAARIHAHADSHAAVGRAPDGPAIHEEEDGDLVLRVPAFLAVHVDHFVEPAIATDSFDWLASADSLMRQPPEVVRSHGPPPAENSAPRAPPAFPVLI